VTHQFYGGGIKINKYHLCPKCHKVTLGEKDMLKSLKTLETIHYFIIQDARPLDRESIEIIFVPWVVQINDMETLAEKDNTSEPGIDFAISLSSMPNL
jgi:hypothetical protein